MKNLLTVVFATAIIALAGCGSSNPPPPIPDAPQPPPEPAATIVVLQASPDAPTLDVRFDDEFPPPADSELVGMDYKSGTPSFTVFSSGMYEFQVDGNLPDGTTETVIGPVDMTFEANTIYSIVTAGNYGEIEQFVFEQPLARTGATARLRIMHVAPLQGPVDVYVTAPDADLTLEAPLGPIDFGEALDPLELAPGDYQLRVTTAGDSADVLLDTGDTTLNDLNDLIVAIVENTTAGAMPISLVVLDGIDAVEVLDATSTGDVRVVHSSAEAGTIDVLAAVDDEAGIEPVELFTDLIYTDVTAFAAMAPATYNFSVTPADMPTTELIALEQAVAAGEFYDIIALTTEVTVPLADPAPELFMSLVTNDDRRSVATDAKLRMIHGAPAANTLEDGNQAPVDVYLTEVGADLTLATPELEAFAFATNTGFGGMVPGTYDVTVTAPADPTIIIVPATTIVIDAAGIYTMILRDPDPAVAGDTTGFILTDDFAAPIVLP